MGEYWPVSRTNLEQENNLSIIMAETLGQKLGQLPPAKATGFVSAYKEAILDSLTGTLAAMFNAAT